jgi:membrane-associated phospholipid phosphatase
MVESENERFFFLKVYIKSTLDICSSFFRNDLKLLVWFLYGSLIFAVNISRLFIATHFPHQVIAGTVAGKIF